LLLSLSGIFVPVPNLQSHKYPSKPYQVDPSVDLFHERSYSPFPPVKARVFGPNIDSSRMNTRGMFFVECLQEDCENLYILFQGPTIFSPRKITRNTTLSIVEFVALDAGNYKIHVEVLLKRPGVGNNTYTRVVDSPFVLTVIDGNGGHAGKQHINFPTQQCTEAKWEEGHGRWVPCQMWQSRCPRSGWSWVPEKCYYEIYSSEEIVNTAYPFWLVLAGTSVQRGTFFSIIDTLLGGKAANLTESSFWKCWGWMDFSQGNFRVSYIDFRVHFMFFDAAYLGDNVESDYHRHAMVAIRQLVTSHKGHGPDMFYLELLHHAFIDQPKTSISTLLTIRSWFGLAWQGRFIVHLNKNGLSERGAFTRSVDEGKPRLLQLLGELDASQIDYIDEEHMAFPLLHTMEYALNSGLFGQHWHKQCNLNGIHSCSPVADMAAYQLLNIARPRMVANILQRSSVHRWGDKDTRDIPFQFCLDCPKALVPFSIRHDFLNSAICLPFIPKERP
jgi:hypothetical protein